MPLTALGIEKLQPKDKAYRVADGSGLFIEVSPAGGKLWRWRYYFNRKPQILALGKYPSLTLAQARKARDDARMLVEAGKHPTREKKARKLRSAFDGENTFEKIARRWLDLKQKGLNEKYRKQCLVRMEQHVFPIIGALPITEITIPDVVTVIEKIGNRGTIETARRMKQLISQTFRFASQRGLCQHNPAADLRDILPSTPERHLPSISPAEFPQLLKDIAGYNGDKFTKAAMQILALTFVRTGELIGAKWNEVNFEKAEWHIPAERMKMKRPHLVPLSRQAISILKELQKITGEKEHIFYSSKSKSKHISNGAVLMALRRMGYQKRMCGHGFRSLASTILNEKGYPPDVIERQLAHEDSDKVRSAYNRAEYLLERKKMMQNYADFLDNFLSEKKVISFKTKKA
jgi:integrase